MLNSDLRKFSRYKPSFESIQICIDGPKIHTLFALAYISQLVWFHPRQMPSSLYAGPHPAWDEASKHLYIPSTLREIITVSTGSTVVVIWIPYLKYARRIPYSSKDDFLAFADLNCQSLRHEAASI